MKTSGEEKAGGGAEDEEKKRRREGEKESRAGSGPNGALILFR